MWLLHGDFDLIGDVALTYAAWMISVFSSFVSSPLALQFIEPVMTNGSRSRALDAKRES